MKKMLMVLMVIFSFNMLVACDNKPVVKDETIMKFENAYPRNKNYYQIFVRSFADSDNDGVGDFEGIRQNLTYLKELGIDALWLLPIHESASYHGYDVTDFYSVNNEYGTMADFENLLEDAKKIGIDITIDMVLNHTSNEHPWFNEHRDWYTEFSYFGGWMPELDYSKTVVKEEMLKVMRYWIDKGVSGFRVDAAVHLFNSKTYVNGMPSTADMKVSVEYFKFLRAQLRQTDPNVYMVGEVWTPKDISATFYQGFDSLFNFDLSDRLIDIARGHNGGFKYATDVNTFYKSFQNVMDAYNNQFVGQNESYIDAPFLRNHDQDRVASLMNETENIFAAELLLGLKGNPYIYYGEELGMKGIKSDGTNDIWDETRRLPFVWGDKYQTDWCDMCINYDKDTKSLKVQKEDEGSLYQTYKTLLNLRQTYPALKYGGYEVIDIGRQDVSAYKRVATLDDFTQEVIIYHNFTAQPYQVDITGYKVIYHTMDRFNGSMASKTSLYLVKI